MFQRCFPGIQTFTRACMCPFFVFDFKSTTLLTFFYLYEKGEKYEKLVKKNKKKQKL